MTSDTMRPLQMAPEPTHDPADTLEAMFRSHATDLRRRLLAMTRDPSLADDLTSEAFLRLALEIGAGRAPTNARAWLYRVGANLVVSRARRASVATRAMPGLLERDVAPSPEDVAVTRERDVVLRDCLASLRSVDREVVVLAARGYRSEEIARMTGSSGAATRTRLCRARGRLREQLELVGMTA